MLQNRKRKEEKKVVLAAKPLISLPIWNLVQSDNGANDISINVNIDNRARESDQGDGRNGIADISNHKLVNGAVTYAQDIAVCLFYQPRGVQSFRTNALGILELQKVKNHWVRPIFTMKN